MVGCLKGFLFGLLNGAKQAYWMVGSLAGFNFGLLRAAKLAYWMVGCLASFQLGLQQVGKLDGWLYSWFPGLLATCGHFYCINIPNFQGETLYGY